MNLELDYTGFEGYLYRTEQRNILCGIRIQYLFKFDNGYGASVVKGYGSYGYYKDLWELAVVEFVAEDEWHLCYSSPVTEDVLGYLTDEQVRDILGKIRDLED